MSALSLDTWGEKDFLNSLSCGWPSADFFEMSLSAYSKKLPAGIQGVVALSPKVEGREEKFDVTLTSLYCAQGKGECVRFGKTITREMNRVKTYSFTAVLDPTRNEFLISSIPGENAVFSVPSNNNMKAPTHCLIQARDASKPREVDHSSATKHFLLALVNKNGTPTPGIRLEKLGVGADPQKIFQIIRLENVRLPVDALLDDGHLGSRAQLAIRAAGMRDRARDVAAASTIALKNALSNGSLSTRLQQNRLLPQLANAFAFLTASAELNNLNEKLPKSKDPVKDARELELLSAGLKAITSRAAGMAIEQCALSCAPFGHFEASGLPQLLSSRTALDALDGDNLELLKELGMYANHFFDLQYKGLTFKGALMEVAAVVRAGEGRHLGVGHGYLAESYCFNPRLFDPTRPDHVVPVFEQVARTLVFRVFDHVNNLKVKERVDEKTALDRASVDILKAARAHARVFLVKALFARLAQLPQKLSTSIYVPVFEPTVSVSRLHDLAVLFVIGEILDNDYKFHKDSQLNDSQLESLKHRFYGLLSSLAPHAADVLAAFAVPNKFIGNSPLLHKNKVEQAQRYTTPTPSGQNTVAAKAKL